MDLRYTDDQIAFRDEVRDFLATNLLPEMARKVRLGRTLNKAEHEPWQAILNERGWLAGNWPVEHGGTGWDAVQRHVFEDECARTHAPRIVPFGLAMLGPVLQAFGSEASDPHPDHRLSRCAQAVRTADRQVSGVAASHGGSADRACDCRRWGGR